MDPIANIKEQVALAKAIAAYEDSPEFLAGDSEVSEYIIAKANRLAELVLTQHKWRLKGGFDPYRPKLVEVAQRILDAARSYEPGVNAYLAPQVEEDLGEALEVQAP